MSTIGRERVYLDSVLHASCTGEIHRAPLKPLSPKHLSLPESTFWLIVATPPESLISARADRGVRSIMFRSFGCPESQPQHTRMADARLSALIIQERGNDTSQGGLRNCPCARWRNPGGAAKFSR